jgi:hypothetical protein|tara:strand:+ start:35288 stop:36010 length:723 start_codon:yes stop_codon:yes gene_type:complete
MFKLPKATLYIVPVIASIGLTACFGEYRHDLIPANASTFFHAYEERSEDMREALKGTDVVFNMGRFVDHRIPEAHSSYEPHIVLHTYNPDRLPGSAPAFVRSVIEESFNVNRDVANPQVREIMFELRDIDLRILNGNFISGKFGRYYTRIAADVNVRDSQGNVLVDKPYEMELETIRQSFSGQQPSEAEDWNDMSRTMKLLLRNLSFEIMNDALNAQGYEVHNQKLKDNPKRLSNEVFAE